MVDCIVTHDLRVLTRTTSFATGAVATLFASLFVGLLGLIAAPTGASAQYYSSPYGYGNRGYRPYGYYQRKKKRRIRRARRTSKSRKRRSYSKTYREPVGRVMILVSLKKQRVFVHDKTGLVAEAPISSGRRGLETPKGIFTILQKNKRHYSNLYANAPMPNMQRITWSGVAMHGGPLPGYPASHGCIRLPYSFAKTLFGMTSMHGRVIVGDDPATPRSIQHAQLFQPLPGGPPLTSQASLSANGVAVAEAAPESRIDSDLGSVIGVRPANAAEVARLDDPGRLQRANKYRRKRIEQKTKIDKELVEAQEAYELFHIDAKRTADELEATRVALRKGQALVSTRKRAAKKADGEAASAHRKLKDFDRKYRNVSRKQTADRLQKLAALEQTLDDRVLRLDDAAEAAHKDVFAAERRISGLKSSVTLAAQTFTTAKKKLAPVKKRLAAAKAAIERYKKEEKQRAKPISVFISGKTGRLYARQGWYPVIDIPVTIKDPDTALGTHLFTAISANANNTGVDWNFVTVEDGTSTDNKHLTRYRKYYGKKQGLRQLRSTANAAQLALDRIDIPQDARDKIEDLMKPGSSIIISDYPKSIETGKHTDFIVLTR